ncbi:alpha/beta-hydrolase [Xylariaceae sp. FL0804]|nr:alpha/beta-hydrolase [Xylariaceae sp. FL0804]
MFSLPSVLLASIAVATTASSSSSAAAAAALAAEDAQRPIPAPSSLYPSRHNHNDDDDDDTPLPLVIWHGLGDNYAAEGLQSVGALAEEVHPGTFVYFVALGADASADRTATFYGDVNAQVAAVCDALAAHPILSTAPAVDALGFSQGGQFLRAYAQRCAAPPLRSLVTFGSQHNGIVDYRACGRADLLCRGALALMHSNTWGAWAQAHLVPAQYFRDPADLASYRAHSNFLADVNNELVDEDKDEDEDSAATRGSRRNETYARNLAALENFVMYMFADDTTVIPKETSWFAEVEGGAVTPLRKRRLYTEDWLGLRALDAKGGLRFETTPGDHMEISDDVLEDVFRRYFGPLNRTSERGGGRDAAGASVGEL